MTSFFKEVATVIVALVIYDLVIKKVVLKTGSSFEEGFDAE
jgi:hypothetical protein